VEDAAVPALPDLPFNLQLEVAEFVLRNEILNTCVFFERAIRDAPAVWNRLCFVPAPRVERRSVKKRAPGLSVGLRRWAGRASRRDNLLAWTRCRHNTTNCRRHHDRSS